MMRVHTDSSERHHKQPNSTAELDPDHEGRIHPHIRRLKESNRQHWIKHGQASTLQGTRENNIDQAKVDLRRERRDKYAMTIRWIEKILHMAVNHLRGAH